MVSLTSYTGLAWWWRCGSIRPRCPLRARQIKGKSHTLMKCIEHKPQLYPATGRPVSLSLSPEEEASGAFLFLHPDRRIGLPVVTDLGGSVLFDFIQGK